jgi:hypothetical protein
MFRDVVFSRLLRWPGRWLHPARHLETQQQWRKDPHHHMLAEIDNTSPSGTVLGLIHRGLAGSRSSARAERIAPARRHRPCRPQAGLMIKR